MAGALIGEAALGEALGKAFSLLSGTVEDMTNKARLFEPTLKRLQSMLQSLTPIVEDIIRLNRGLEHREEETNKLIDQMKKGEKLVSKCLKIQWWNYRKKLRYAGKLLELNMEILGFFQSDLQVLNSRTQLETLVRVNNIHNHMNLLVKISRLSCAAPLPPDYIVGLHVSLKELKVQLLKKEVPVLVLTAAGGCGKTTLVEMLCQDEEIKGTYKDNIFFVPVSKTPNLKVIIQRIFCHRGEQKLEFQSDEDAIIQLQHMLRNEVNENKSILLILDDVWSGSESLLEKLSFGLPNYKILVTSRTAFPRFRFTYKLKPLNDDDAMKLFLHSAGLQDGSSSYIPDGEMVKKIVKGCGGFPLALKVVGKSLCGQSAATWHLRVVKWSRGCSILDTDIDGDLLECLKSSLEFKDNEMILRECFMDLGSFPEDQKIPVAALIDMWSELYELKMASMQLPSYMKSAPGI